MVASVGASSVSSRHQHTSHASDPLSKATLALLQCTPDAAHIGVLGWISATAVASLCCGASAGIQCIIADLCCLLPSSVQSFTSAPAAQRILQLPGECFAHQAQSVLFEVSLN
eukprot:GHUV01040464.1.p2 GENE.GHUV01040464.1~~GHUV01040464.1.p2  ORF type:complete len:113 (+),score=15.07 GHUV01040464.1:126-464(+)